MDIAIIGAGIAGLLTAVELSGNRRVDAIAVYEKRRRNHVPRKHCSGLVSRSTLHRIPYADRFIENNFNSITIYLGRGIEVELSFEKNAIYKIDRVSHEKHLLDLAVDRGVKIEFNSNVIGIEVGARGCRVRPSNKEAQTYTSTIVAEGYPPSLAKVLGLKAYIEALKGIQLEVYLEKKLCGHALSKLYTYLNTKNNEFSWFIPITERKAVIGVASSRNSIGRVIIYRRFFEKKLHIDINRISDLYGGAVVRGYPIEIVKRNVFGIGDSVATVKSLSGGGLYPISVISKIYGENIHRVEMAKAKLRNIVKELQNQYKMYRAIYMLLGEIGSKIRIPRLSVGLGSEYFYDHHEKALLRMITALVFKL